jgi:antitoxin PrlF
MAYGREILQEKSMGIFVSKLSQKSQTTIPSEVRELIGAEPGGLLQYRALDDGTVVIRAKKRGAMGLKGIFARPDKPIDIDAAIAEEVWERNKPGGRGSRS